MKTTTANHWSVCLDKFFPCSEVRNWALSQPDKETAWKNCQRGDWLLWLLGKVAGDVDSDSRKKLVSVCADCAELALPIFEKKYPEDKRVRECIQACRDYAEGKISRDVLRDFRRAAADADAYAYTAADAYAYTAADAYAAADAAYAAYAAYAAGRQAREKVLAQCADLVRAKYPEYSEV